MKYLLIPVGYFLGSLLIGGLFYSIFSNSAGGPNKMEEEKYSWIGRIIGVIIAIIIISNMN